MNFAGAGLILLACLALACRIVAARRREFEALRDMEAALERLSAELEQNLTGLPELTDLLAKSAQGSAQRFFRQLQELLTQLGDRPFCELWNEALDAVPELEGDDRSALERLGAALGRYALDAQLAAAANCRMRLRQSAAARRDTLGEERRLAFGLSVVAGALLCILLY